MRTLILVLIVACNALAQIAPKQQELFFTALHKNGSPVEKLDVSDLKVTGVKRTIAVAPLRDTPLTVALLLDMSGSERTRFADEQVVAITLVSHLVRPTVDSSMLVAFSEEPYLDQDLTADPSLVMKRTASEQARGASAIFDALVAAADHLSKQSPRGRPRVILLVSDGADNASRASLSQANLALQKAGVRVYAISVNAESDRGVNNLYLITEATGGQVFRFSTSRARKAPEAAKDIANSLVPELRSWWQVQFESEGKPNNKSISLVPLDNSVMLRFQALYVPENQ